MRIGSGKTTQQIYTNEDKEAWDTRWVQVAP